VNIFKAVQVITSASFMLSGTLALASASPDCVHLDAEFKIAPDPTCAIAEDPIANAYLFDTLPSLAGTCFSYQFPATLSYETAEGTTVVEVDVSGNSGVISNVDPIPPFLAYLVLDDQQQPSGLLATWFQAVSSLKLRDASGQLIGVFVTRDQGLLEIDPNASVPIPLRGTETLNARGMLNLDGKGDPRAMSARIRANPWSGTLAADGDELAVSDPAGATLGGTLCAEGR